MSSMRPAAAAFSEIRPSCGLRRSAMSSFASTFRRVVTPGARCFGIAVGDVEDAVDAVAHDQVVLLRLDVDVARAVLGRFEDHRVDEPDERRVREAVVGLEVVVLLRFGLDGAISSAKAAFMASAARERRRSSARTSSSEATWNSTV